MKKGKYEKVVPAARKRRGLNTRIVTLVLALTLLVGVAVGGTIAWLTDSTDEVENTFTVGNINITLTETDTDTAKEGEQHEYKMIPGWTIAKDPKVKVKDGSEDCWLFVKITESTTPDLDDYIAYAIADLYDAMSNPDGWQIVQEENTNGVTVIGRKVYKNADTEEFDILGAGSYTDPMGTPNETADDVTVTWTENQVGVKPSVTERMMTNIATNKPTLSFQAYAVQLFKTNSDGNKETTTDEFTAAEAWAKAAELG